MDRDHAAQLLFSLQVEEALSECKDKGLLSEDDEEEEWLDMNNNNNLKESSWNIMLLININITFKLHELIFL